MTDIDAHTTSVEAESPSLPTSRQEALDRARALRTVLAEDAVMIDTTGADPTRNMQLIGEAGLNSLNVPKEFGGLWEGSAYGGWREVIEVLTELSAADGSTGQCWATMVLVSRDLFSSEDLPQETKAQLADELLHQGRRLVSSNAEAGGTGPVVGRRVPGGVVVSGVKTFNTNSGGGGRDIASVGFALLGDDEQLENATPHHALIRLDNPALELRHDWDNMGQRGTYSQTIVYRDVFVADGWHYASPLMDPTHFPHWLGALMCLHAGILQGIGEGALEAALAFVRQLNRPGMPMFKTADNDPLMHRQIGEMSSELAAARALMVSIASALQTPELVAEPAEMAIQGMRSKVASTQTALDVTSRIHDLTGARSTASKYRLDRFWRNARTYGSHDSVDAKNAFIGSYELSGQMPSITNYMSA